MTDLTLIVQNVAKVVNAVFALVKGGGLFQIIAAVNAVVALKSVDFAAALTKLKSLSELERAQLEAAFENTLDLGPDLNDKIGGLVAALEELISIVAEGIQLGTQAVNLVTKVRALLGV